MEQDQLHYKSRKIFLAESHIELLEHPDWKEGEPVNGGIPLLKFDFWVDDISKYRKDVFVQVDYYNHGSGVEKPFSIWDVFVNRIMLSRRKEDQEKDYMWEYMTCATSEMLPYIRKTVKQQLRKLGLDDHFSCRIDFVQAYVQIQQGLLRVDELSKEEALHTLPNYFPHIWGNPDKSEYESMLLTAKKVYLCELSPEGRAIDVARRMQYAIDYLSARSKKIFFYIETGNDMIFNPDSAVIHNRLSKYNVVKFFLGDNREKSGRYSRAVLGVIC